MEMEALVFGALTHMAGIRSAVVCVTLLDRLKGDQVTLMIMMFLGQLFYEIMFADNHTKRGVDVLADKTYGSCGKVSLLCSSTD